MGYANGMGRPYDYKTIFRYVIVMAFVFGLMMATQGAGYVVMIPFILYALFMGKYEMLLFGLFFTSALINTNPFFTPKGMVFAIAFRGLFVVCGLYGVLQFLSAQTAKVVTPLLGMLLYLAYMFIPSASGWAPQVSYMKLALFIATYMTFAYVASKSAQGRIDLRKMRCMVLAFGIVYILGSVILIPFPEISQMNAAELLQHGQMSTSLYKGMSNHSQEFGMLMCMLMIFIFADLLLNIQKPDMLYLLLLVCGFGLIVKSSSRTAMGSLIAGVMFLTYAMMKVRGIRIMWRYKIISLSIVALIMVVGSLAVIPSFREEVASFALKYGADRQFSDVSFDAVVDSRMGLVDQQMYNFHNRPATGWGFQVSEEVANMMRHTTGLILSAPVEKGVWVTAVLEEGGICGLIIYGVFFLVALFKLMARNAYMGAAMFFVIHVANLGEFTMFSMSGIGCMWWVMVFLALVFDAKRIHCVSGYMPVYYQGGARP